MFFIESFVFVFVECAFAKGSIGRVIRKLLEPYEPKLHLIRDENAALQLYVGEQEGWMEKTHVIVGINVGLCIFHVISVTL